MAIRIISSLIGIPLLIFIISNGGILLTMSVLIVSIIGLKEFYGAFNNINIYPVKYISYFFTVLLYVFFIINKQEFFLLCFYLIAISLLTINIFSKKYNIIDVSLTLIGYLYIPFSLLHIILISQKYNYLVWFVFIIAWTTDTFAYFSGYFFGSKKLIPSVSPKKTIEGSIGGIIGCICAIFIFTYIFVPNLQIQGILLGFLGSILSQIGDLIASKIKRYVGIKDFGNIIPGHGGIIDRFDSILIISPLVYYFFNIIQ